MRYYSSLIIRSTYKLAKRYKLILTNNYMQLTKYDRKHKKKHGAVIQCKRERSFSIQNPFFSDIKRVYYIIITVGKVSSHRNFGECSSSRPQVFYKVGVLKKFAKFKGKHQRRSYLMKL